MENTREIYAFTICYSSIAARLISGVTLKYGDKIYVSERALWDTGATNTSISQKVSERLGLNSGRLVGIDAVSGSIPAEEYIIDIKLQDDTVYLKNIRVTNSISDVLDVDVLIGMDIISRGDFTVSNYKGKTMFSFRMPSLSHADYREGIVPADKKKSKKLPFVE